MKAGRAEISIPSPSHLRPDPGIDSLTSSGMVARIHQERGTAPAGTSGDLEGARPLVWGVVKWKAS